MKERTFTAITLVYTAENGSTTNLVQYLENDVYMAHLSILDSINDIERGKFWPGLYGLDTPCPALYEWQSKDKSADLYCTVEQVTLVEEGQVSTKSELLASDFLRNLRNGGDPEFKVKSNRELKLETQRLIALQSSLEPITLLAEMSSNGMVDKIYSECGDFCVMVIDEPEVDSSDFNYPSMEGDSKLVYGLRSSVDKEKIAWFDLITNIGQPNDDSSYVLEGDQIVEINSAGGREVLVLTSTLPEERLRSLVGFLND
ncbi:hypothetical protein F7U66_00365 [Vibrio parahaemolyticus]|nr:hypothetical protein [Vibrio parahaemolyticus]